MLGVLGHIFEDLRDDVVGGDAFGFCFEVQDESVTQCCCCDGVDVLEAHVETALSEGAHFAGEDETLRASRAAAKAQVLVGHGRGGIGLWMRGEDEAHGVVLHMRRDGDLADELLEFEQRGAIEDFADLRLHTLSGAGDDFGQLGSGGIAVRQRLRILTMTAIWIFVRSAPCAGRPPHCLPITVLRHFLS